MRRISQALTAILMLGLLTAPLYGASVNLTKSAGFSAAAPVSDAPGVGFLNVLSLGALVVGIAIRKDVGAIASKFVTRASAAAGDYKDGVANAGGAWEAATIAGESNYEQGTQDAIANKRFSRGVTGKSQKYQQNAVNLGSQRFAPGVANAKDAYQKGMAPVISTLNGLTLPPKGPRRSPQNQQRSNAVAIALGALKTGK